jgi:hypothetical protein
VGIMLTRRFGHFQYLGLLAAILLVWTAALDSYHHPRRNHPHSQLQFDNDSRQGEYTSVDGEIKKLQQFCESVSFFTDAIISRIITLDFPNIVTFVEILLPSAASARASPRVSHSTVHCCNTKLDHITM